MIRKLKLEDGVLYVEHKDGWRIVTTEPKDAKLRTAYRKATQAHNVGRERLEWLPDGEYYYCDGKMYARGVTG